jgi:hypothetical protein
MLTLLVRVLEGPGGGGAILPRLRAEVVIETRTSGHRLGVEIGGEGAVLLKHSLVSPLFHNTICPNAFFCKLQIVGTSHTYKQGIESTKLTSLENNIFCVKGRGASSLYYWK